MPVDYELRDGIGYATIRTPASSVNILNRDTTRELEQVIRAIDTRSTEALVFRSGCLGSFVNGVGLMLAHAVQTTAGIVEASRPARRAYAAVRACPVPTIAAIQGTCWGCGVELVLHCDYRLADDWFETHLYMTELNDYLFVPLFASTWNLPHQVGLSEAIEMLLWGKRIRAAEGRKLGIVDGVIAADRFNAEVHDFAKSVASEPRRDTAARAAPWRADDEAVVDRTRRRIAELPEAERPVYERTLDLLVRAARHDLDRDEHRLAEIAASADSALAIAGKRAFAFFYLRHMNQSSTEADPAPAQRIEIAARRADEDRAFTDWYAALAAKPLRVARLRSVELELDRSESLPDLLLRSARSDDARGIPVWTELAAVPGSESLQLYAPRAVGRPTVEIKAEPDARARVRRLVAIFRSADFEVVVSQASARFAIAELVRAWVAPVTRFLDEAQDDREARCAVAGASLVALGFGSAPFAAGFANLTSTEAKSLATSVDPTGRVTTETIATLAEVRARSDARPDHALMAGITLSLLDGVRGCKTHGGVAQPRAIDVMAREVLGFPLSTQSLCSWLHPSRIASVLAHADTRWVDESVVEHAKEFVENDVPFYR